MVFLNQGDAFGDATTQSSRFFVPIVVKFGRFPFVIESSHAQQYRPNILILIFVGVGP
jgi:hypothetical protein